MSYSLRIWGYFTLGSMALSTSAIKIVPAPLVGDGCAEQVEKRYSCLLGIASVNSAIPPTATREELKDETGVLFVIFLNMLIVLVICV